MPQHNKLSKEIILGVFNTYLKSHHALPPSTQWQHTEGLCSVTSIYRYFTSVEALHVDLGIPYRRNRGVIPGQRPSRGQIQHNKPVSWRV